MHRLFCRFIVAGLLSTANVALSGGLTSSPPGIPIVPDGANVWLASSSLPGDDADWVHLLALALPPQESISHRHSSKTDDQHAEQEYRKRAFPLGYVPPGAMSKALAQTKAAEAANPLFGTVVWNNIGPNPVIFENSLSEFIPCSGRVTALAVDPGDPSHWLIGTGQGGIWETFNSGTNWASFTDAQASLAIGAITFAPDNPSLVYAGTGEANFRADAYAGQGLLVSSDGGTFWQMLNTNFADTSFSHIDVNPGNSNNLVVATVRGGAGVFEESSGTNIVPGAPSRGIFVSINGGTNFTQVLTGEATALAADPANFSQQYAGLGEIYGAPTNGVYRTTDQWATSQLIDGPWTALATPAQMGRIAIAISPSNPNTVYVGVSGTRTNYVASLLGIWCSSNAWAATPTWSSLALESGPADDSDPNNFNDPRFWNNFDLIVDTTNAAAPYLAGDNGVWKYFLTNNFSTWFLIADPNQLHPGNHVMAWVPAGNNSFQMLLGNDGGVWLSDAYGHESWQDLNAGLPITQIYKGAVDPTHNSTLTLAGSQDNFTEVFVGLPLWPEVFGGSGGDCAISAFLPGLEWAISATTSSDTNGNFASIFRTTDGGFDFGNAADALDNANSLLPFYNQFFVHFEKCPNLDDLFIAGTAQLWRCDNFFSSSPSEPDWKTNSPIILGADGRPVPISAMAFSPADLSDSSYAFGTEDGQVFITTNSGASWNNLNPAGGSLPGRYVSGLAFSPSDTNTLYVSFSGFDEGTPGHPGHLFKTTNALATAPIWKNVSPPVDLPNNCLAIDPNIPNLIYVGADIGIWLSGDGGNTWMHYGPSSGMPIVAVYDIRIDSASRVTAFTHGRSAFVLSSGPIIIPPFKCQVCPLDCPSCNPGETWLNPGDLVTVEFPLENTLPIETVDLKATMLATPGVTPVTGTQDYGAIGQGVTVSRSFTFMVSEGAAGGGVAPQGTGSSCGDPVQVSFQLQDQGNSLGQVSVPFLLGVPSYPLTEDFDEVPPGGLPPGWFPMPSGADLPWAVTTNPPPNVPVAEEDVLTSPLINSSAFVPDSAGVGQSSLTSMPFPVAGTQARLYFRQAFDVSTGNDGGILEIAIGSQPFTEITQAGGSFTEDGYNAVLSDRNPLGPRAAWSGNSGGWVPTWVNLPASAAGQSVQLRWLFGSVRGMNNGGWFIDSVRMVDPVCLPAVSNPIIVNPALNGHNFTFGINTVSDRSYVIEYSTNLNGAVWQTLETLPGTNGLQTVSVPTGSSVLFFRFIVQ